MTPSTRNVILTVMVCGVAVAFAIWVTPEPLKLRDTAIDEVKRILPSLFLIALLLERTLEVFITTWRGPEAEQGARKVRCANQRIVEFKERPADLRTAGATQLDTLVTASETAQSVQTEYRSATQRIALWAALVLGIMISACGFRTLEALLEPEWYKSTEVIRIHLLRVIDMLVTGSVLAGGSDGVHKILQALTSFMEATSRRAKASS